MMMTIDFIYNFPNINKIVGDGRRWQVMVNNMITYLFLYKIDIVHNLSKYTFNKKKYLNIIKIFRFIVL